MVEATDEVKDAGRRKVGESSVEGVLRQLKRGRRTQSRIKESGIGEVTLEGGIHLTDGDIEACNSQILRKSAFEEATILCELGKSAGLIRQEDQTSVVKLFSNWETRDRQAADVQTTGLVLEKSQSINADN